jgi:hypothetical protein
MTNQVDFVCVRPDHQVSTLVEALTVHDELWAYCPSAQPEPHDWRPCGGMDLADLRTLLQSFPATQIVGVA